MRVLLLRRRETERQRGSACVSKQTCIPAELPWLADADLATDFFAGTVPLSASSSALRFLAVARFFTSSCHHPPSPQQVPVEKTTTATASLHPPSCSSILVFGVLLPYLSRHCIPFASDLVLQQHHVSLRSGKTHSPLNATHLISSHPVTTDIQPT